MKYAFLGICVLFSMCSTFAADNANYTVVTYCDDIHHNEAHAFGERNFHHFVDLPADPVEAQQKREQYSASRHIKLREGKPSNPIPFIENTFHRMLLHHQKTLAGMITYFIKEEDKNCFIDTLHIEAPHNTNANFLVLTGSALHYACLKKASYVQTYVKATERNETQETEYQELTKIGFVAKEQNELEKKHNGVMLQLHSSAAIVHFKLF